MVLTAVPMVSVMAQDNVPTLTVTNKPIADVLRGTSQIPKEMSLARMLGRFLRQNQRTCGQIYIPNLCVWAILPRIR